MSTMSFAPVAAPDEERDRPVRPTLWRDLEQCGLPLERAHVHPWSGGLRLSVEGSTFWVYGPALIDPARGRDGRLVIPAPHLRTLRAWAAADLPPHEVVVAHEVPAERVAVHAPAARTGIQPCSDAVARALVGPPPAHPTVRRAVRLLDAVVGGGTAAIGSAARRAGDVILDPIVFAVFAEDGLREGEPALWVPLVAWGWASC